MNDLERSLVNEKENCCGCGSCALVCPTNAIHMVPMELGCVYPQIDPTKCIDCHKCERVCIYRKQRKISDNAPKAYAAVSNNQAVLDNAASGGVFGAIAHGIIDCGGAVFGCSMELEDGILTPRHICAEDHEMLRKLQGSKYVQSELGNTFLQVKKMLQTGRTVLFSGTPCQVDALKVFLNGIDTTNLFTIDIICHGVPSGQLFREYLMQSNKEYETFIFRDKRSGRNYCASYTYREDDIEIKKKYLPAELSSFYSYFLAAELCRECCYSCRYSNLNRIGDLTIGDYWGIENEHPEYLKDNGGTFDVTRGVSSLLVNTSKGQTLLERFGSDLIVAESRPEKVMKWNRQLNQPSRHSDVRGRLLERYSVLGYAGVEREYRERLGIRLIVRKIKWFLFGKKR